MDEKEFAVLSTVGKDVNLTQRQVSREVGLSLGMTNVVLKRLVRKGYLKMRGLNQRKIEYILTPRGFIEKTKKSYRYVLKTINQVSLLKQRIQEIILREYAKGKRKFLILGDGELADLTEIAFNDLGKNDLVYKKISRQKRRNYSDSVVLVVNPEFTHFKTNNRYINLVSETSNLPFL